MAYFCKITGARIAGPGVLDTHELTEEQAKDPALVSAQRYPSVVEADGAEVPLTTAKAVKSEGKGDKPSSK